MRRAYKQRRAIFIGWGSRGGISELLAVAGGTAVSIVESVSVLNVCNLFVVSVYKIAELVHIHAAVDALCVSWPAYACSSD